MVIFANGSSIQIVVALLVVAFNMLLVLKLAPFVDSADDWLSFLTSLQLVLTLLGGLLIKMDDPNAPTYEQDSMGMLMVVVNALGFVALFCSIVSLHPAIRNKINTMRATEKHGGTKVAPRQEESNTEPESNEINYIKSWGAN